MNLQNKFNAKRIVSGLLASIMLSQVFIYGDGSCEGLLHTNTINAISNDMEVQQNRQDLIDEFEQNVYELENFNQPKTSLFSLFSNDNDTIQVDSFNVSGYIGFEDDRPCEATVIVFNDNWETIALSTTDSNGWFSIETGSIIDTTSTTHIKVECNGYLPRFYKDMGFGSYQLGTQDNPEVLLCGDTTYNEWCNNQWSDEVINNNDITFIQQSVETYTQNSRYDEYYDTSGDGVIDDTDISYLSSFLGYYYNGDCIKSSDDSIILDDAYMNIFLIDYNENYVIEQGEIDYFLGLYPFGTVEYKGDSSLQYMDIDGDGYISQDDANYLIGYTKKNNGLNPYNDYISNITLTGDTYHNGAMYLENTNLDLNGYKLVVNGNFVFRTANPYNSMWNDNPAVTLNINGGTLYIKEQFDFGQANSYDKIIMDKENGELYIFGNWNYITLADMEGLWTDGTIYFCGANWQVNEASGEKSVYSTEKHSIWFYYEYGQQVIRWDNTKDTTFDSATGKKNTPRTLNFNYTDKSTGTCLGVFFPYGYTDDRYYFRPSLPDYITNYKDEDGNGVDDKIDNLFEIEDYENIPLDWLIGSYEYEERILNLIDITNPYEKENLKALSDYAYDVNQGNDGAIQAYDTVSTTITTLADEIPNEVKLAYDGARFIISLSPDPVCQTIDFVLSIGDVVYDTLTFECTTEWIADLGMDLFGLIPFVGTSSKILKNADNFDKIAELKEVKGLLDCTVQKAIYKSVEGVSDINKIDAELVNIKFLDTIDEMCELKRVLEPVIEFSNDEETVIRICYEYGDYVINIFVKYKKRCNDIVTLIKGIQKIKGIVDTTKEIKHLISFIDKSEKEIDNILLCYEIFGDNFLNAYQIIQNNLKDNYSQEDFEAEIDILKNCLKIFGNLEYTDAYNIISKIQGNSFKNTPQERMITNCILTLDKKYYINKEYIEKFAQIITYKLAVMIDYQQICNTLGENLETFAVSVAIDSDTGQVFCGFSGQTLDGQELNPTRNKIESKFIKDRLDTVIVWINKENDGNRPASAERTDSNNTILPPRNQLDNCGERNSINNATNNNCNPQNLYVYTIKQGAKEKFKPCNNCQCLYYYYIKGFLKLGKNTQLCPELTDLHEWEEKHNGNI